jgi:hypothetical protein
VLQSKHNEFEFFIRAMSALGSGGDDHRGCRCLVRVTSGALQAGAMYAFAPRWFLDLNYTLGQAEVAVIESPESIIER